jgi:quercetin dioxygenase-like cupin family protein
MPDPNLPLLEDAVYKLAPFLGEVVFVGGVTLGLLITDKAAAPIRGTNDVDVIAEIITYADYMEFSERLRKADFTEDAGEQPLTCRWHNNDLILDVLPLSTEVLGFTNRWYPPVPPDDLNRTPTFANPDHKGKLHHIGLVGDTYTITIDGDDAKGRFCVVDMHIPPGGGPGPHRHDFEETFIVLDGEIEATFRGKKSIVHAGETVNIPANAPHRFHNTSANPARLICICSPAGQEKFFLEVGVPVATRTTAPPKLDDKQMAAFLEKAKGLAPMYHTELLKEA